MQFKKITGWLHLWLGLVSGIIVLIISLTGALLSWQPEIQEWTQQYQFVQPEQRPFVPVSVMRRNAEAAMQGKRAFRILLEGKSKAAVVQFYQKKPYYYFNVYVNPYTGVVQKVLDRDDEFFRVILNGHLYLWLPQEAGHLVVIYSTLVFLLMLISGIVLWWPRNAARRKVSFRIKWNASPKRLNYDLHNVLGFYACWIIIFAALTGLVWGFDWMAKAEFWIFSGGGKRPEGLRLISAPPTWKKGPAIDLVQQKITALYPDAAVYTLSFPANDSAVIQARAYPNSGVYYNGNYHYFDQYTGVEKPAPFMGRYNEATLAEKASRMNYDIHVGSIAGLPGRLLMFLASLVSASLPVTGFLVWKGRRGKKKTARRTPQLVNKAA